MKKRSIYAAALTALLFAGYTGSAVGDAPDQARFFEAAVQLYFNTLRGNEAALRELLKEMPKGADLHSHLSGAVTTERLIEWGAEDGLCVDTATFTASPGHDANGPHFVQQRARGLVHGRFSGQFTRGSPALFRYLRQIRCSLERCSDR